MNINREELAWAAGLYDGEGCTTYKSSTNRQPVMSISQNNPFVLKRFKQAVGVGEVYGPYVRKGKPNTRPIWNWQSGGFETTQVTIAMIWQWLSPQKREQAVKVFGQYRGRKDMRLKKNRKMVAA